MLIDAYQRRIEYLRLSVTDRCNIRCRYCMPAAQPNQREREDILTIEEIVRVVGVFARLGVKCLRITGGEPLVRPGLPELISQLTQIPGLNEVVLTTNGLLLRDLALPLRQAGLSRINIHMDTLSDKSFSYISRGGNLEHVLAGIRAAQTAGFTNIKINTVFLRGFNDNEITDLIQFGAKENLIIRFIELMPIGPGKDMGPHFISAGEIKSRLKDRFTLIPYGPRLGRGPAEYFKVLELNSVIGFIHPVSVPFCDKCNRVRLSADGRLQDCLAYDESESLLDFLRGGKKSEKDLETRIRRMVGVKRLDHQGFNSPQCPATAGMYGIGG